MSALSLSAAKPVGLWCGNSWQRVGELLRATLFNPQWTADKPEHLILAKDFKFEDYSSIVFLRGFNKEVAFREWTKERISQAENYVRNGGVIIIIFDGSSRGKSSSTGAMAKLLGGKSFGEFSGKAEIKDASWQECVRNPLVHKMMLGGKKYAALKDFTTAKMIAGNSSGALIAVNSIGKGKVYFVNARLTQAAVNYRRPGSGSVETELEQLFPFVKRFHKILMDNKCSIVKDDRERWDYTPLGPEPVNDEHVAPARKVISGNRKYVKLDGEPLTITANGEARAIFMVGRGYKAGFSRFQRAVQLISGAKIPYVSARSVKEVNGKWRYRGKNYDTKITYLPGKTVSIEAIGNKITIHAPTINLGLQTLLREAFGYRVLWPGDCGEVYTENKNIKIEPFRLTDAPFFKKRGIRNGLVSRTYPHKLANGKTVRLPYEKFPVNGVVGYDPVETIALRREHGGNWYAAMRLGTQDFSTGGGGTFYSWKKKYMQTKPEYFALQFNGKRIQRTDHVRICKSNPQVIKQTVENARKYLNSNKNVDVYLVSPCDGSYDIFCMCKNCREWDPKYQPLGARRVYLGRNRPMFKYPGSSDRVFRFTCEVAKELKKSHPHVKVGYLAYAGYLAPPRYYRDFPDNLMITFVGLQYLNAKGLETHRKYWNFWARVSDNIMLRPNLLLGGGGYPLLYMHEMAKDLRYCAETGMIGSDFDSLVHHWATNGLNYYVLAEMLWDPSRNVDDIIDEYCRLGFGKGAEAMKKYFLLCEKLTGIYAKGSSVTIEMIEDITIEKRESMVSRISKVFDREKMKELAGYLDEARKLTPEGSRERRRVEFIATGYEFTRDRIEFAEKLAKTPRAERKKLAEEQHQYWWKLYKEHPFAVNMPRIAGRQYISYWKRAGLKFKKFE